jgi:RNA polymerase sigma-70 factor (ECF subfamily)
MTMKPYTDEQLLNELVKGDTGALDELYRRYARTLYIFCVRLTSLSGPDQGDDLVHDIFLRVIRGAAGFDPRKASFRTWLFRIARNVCIDKIRQQSKMKVARFGNRSAQDESGGSPAGDGLSLDAIPHAGPDAAQVLARDELLRAVRACLGALPDREEREAILLYYMSGRVLEEIGRILGKSTSTAKNRVRSARDKLRECLTGKGVTSAV